MILKEILISGVVNEELLVIFVGIVLLLLSVSCRAG